MKTELILNEANSDSLGFNCPNQEHQKLFFTINYKRKTLLGSASLLSVIRVFQPDLLVAGKTQLAIITLIARYVLNCYPTKGQEKDETALLKYVLDEDAFTGIKGLRAVVLENGLKNLSEIDPIVDQEIGDMLGSLKWVKECNAINKYVEDNYLNGRFNQTQIKALREEVQKKKLRVAV